MNEFKFSCPNCQQVIEATPEYSGAEIPCPACQTPLVVPAAPGAPPAGGPKLHIAQSNEQGQSAPFVPRLPPVRKKKDRTNLYISLASGAAVIILAVIFGPGLYEKFHHHEQVVAAQEAVTNAPPPPPPPALTVEEILQRVSQVYGALPSYAAQGDSVAVLNVSQINPAAKGDQNLKAKVAMAMAHPDSYRVEWQREFNGRPIGGAVWSTGKGDFISYYPNPVGKARSRVAALETAASVSLTDCEYIPQIFFNDTNSLARRVDSFAKTNGTALNGEDCYILAGAFKARDVILWVDKKTFLIPQIQLVYGKKIEDADLNGLSREEKTRLTTLSKIKGTVTETYNTIVTNKMFAAADFGAPLLALEAPQMRPPPGHPPPARRGVSPYSATDLTRRVREKNAEEQRALNNAP